MWAGGDLHAPGHAGQPVLRRLRALLRTATRRRRDVRRTPRPTVAGNDVTLTLEPRRPTTRTDADPVRDPARTTRRSAPSSWAPPSSARYTDTNVVGTARYFVRAVDADGNRSATTPVISVTPPPPARRDAARRRRHVVVPGRRPGPRHHLAQPGFDTSLVADRRRPSSAGAARARPRTIPSGPITQYFVKHVNVANPSQYKTRHRPAEARRRRGRVRQRRRGRARQPARRARSPRRTPASGFASGAAETPVVRVPGPGSLLHRR